MLPRQAPVLHLEDENGGPASLIGNDLRTYIRTNRKVKLLLISACRTSQESADGYASLMRSLAQTVVPAVIGVNESFPDALSGPFAEALYRGLLLGRTVGDALMTARTALMGNYRAVGLPVCYMQRGGDANRGAA